MLFSRIAYKNKKLEILSRSGNNWGGTNRLVGGYVGSAESATVWTGGDL